MKRFILSIHIVLASILLQAQEKYDLVIVGGTPGGIMTAIAAAKEGKTSVILERSKHMWSSCKWSWCNRSSDKRSDNWIIQRISGL